MAVYVPIRPRWNPRGVTINYVSCGQLCVRSWPKGYRDANTAAQRRQRSKMAQVCRVLPHLKVLLAEGYTPQTRRNGRKVGSYHAAVATSLREWFEDSTHGPQLDTSRLRLTDGVTALPEGLAIARLKDTLRVSWRSALRWQGAKLLIAIHGPKGKEWLCKVIPLATDATSTTMRLPATWRKGTIEAWGAFVGNGGRIRTQTHHATLLSTRGATGATEGRGRAWAGSIAETSRERREMAEKQGDRTALIKPQPYGGGVPMDGG